MVIKTEIVIHEDNVKEKICVLKHKSQIIAVKQAWKGSTDLMMILQVNMESCYLD